MFAGGWDSDTRRPRQTREASPQWGVPKASAPSLLARKGERNPLQGFRATIERTVSNPLRKLYSRNSPQERLLLKVSLSSDETSATGSHQSFAHFDSPGHCKSMLLGFCFSCGFSAFFRFATSRVAAGRQGTGLAGGKDHFREFPHISSFFRFENVHFDISRYNS